jgi:hypothetical protein
MCGRIVTQLAARAPRSIHHRPASRFLRANIHCTTAIVMDKEAGGPRKEMSPKEQRKRALCNWETSLLCFYLISPGTIWTLPPQIDITNPPDPTIATTALSSLVTTDRGTVVNHIESPCGSSRISYITWTVDNINFAIFRSLVKPGKT